MPSLSRFNGLKTITRQNVKHIIDYHHTVSCHDNSDNSNSIDVFGYCVIKQLGIKRIH